MGQSITRQIKRGHVVPVFNEFTGQSDFYKRIRSTGLYGITNNAFGNGVVHGPGITADHLKKKKDAGLKAYMKLLVKHQSTDMKLEKDKQRDSEDKKPGFLKRLFGKK